jgi:hypothetical protein
VIAAVLVDRVLDPDPAVCVFGDDTGARERPALNITDHA